MGIDWEKAMRSLKRRKLALSQTHGRWKCRLVLLGVTAFLVFLGFKMATLVWRNVNILFAQCVYVTNSVVYVDNRWYISKMKDTCIQEKLPYVFEFPWKLLDLIDFQGGTVRKPEIYREKGKYKSSWLTKEMNSNLEWILKLSKKALTPCTASCFRVVSALSGSCTGLVMDKETSIKITVGIINF